MATSSPNSWYMTRWVAAVRRDVLGQLASEWLAHPALPATKRTAADFPDRESDSEGPLVLECAPDGP